jgi:threonine dehydratase
VALAAKQAGVPATIVMPEWASITKQEATRGYQGEVVITGRNLGESLAKAEELAEQGRTFIHPFDDPEIIAGQGTIGLEILSDLPEPDVVLVPIGGGGLISGIAAAVKALRPATRVIGVQTVECPSAYESLRQGKRLEVPAHSSLADGISVKQPGAITFEHIRRWVDQVVLVEEEQIAAAILMLLERKKVLAEGAGAVPLAALMSGSLGDLEGRRVVLVITGGNVDSPLLGRILRKGLIKKGRVMRFSVKLEDVPGSLAGLLKIISRLHANVLHIYHDRSGRDLPTYVTRVELELETRGFEHIDEVVERLEQARYKVVLI